ETVPTSSHTNIHTLSVLSRRNIASSQMTCTAAQCKSWTSSAMRGEPQLMRQWGNEALGQYKHSSKTNGGIQTLVRSHSPSQLRQVQQEAVLPHCPIAPLPHCLIS